MSTVRKKSKIFTTRKRKTPIKFKLGKNKTPTPNIAKQLPDECCECKKVGWVNRGTVLGKWLERLCICIDGKYRCLDCV